MKKSAKCLSLILNCKLLIILIATLLVSCAGEKKSSNSDYVFFKASTLYEEGRYDDAIREYMRLINEGLESGNLYYNLGNCYFKKGELGEALVFYERARRLIPRDSDLRSNYVFARSQIKYVTEEKPESFFQDIMDSTDLLTVNDLIIAVSALYVVLIIFMIMRVFILISRNKTILISSLLIGISIFISISLINRLSLLDKEAIVIKDSVEVRFEPLENSTVHFTLYEGMKISLFQPKKGWEKIKRDDGKIGWVKSQEIKKI